MSQVLDGISTVQSVREPQIVDLVAGAIIRTLQCTRHVMIVMILME